MTVKAKKLRARRRQQQFDSRKQLLSKLRLVNQRRRLWQKLQWLKVSHRLSDWMTLSEKKSDVEINQPEIKR